MKKRPDSLSLFPSPLVNYPFTDPRFQKEWELNEWCLGPVAGVDEAGRGPLAGPVTAAAVILNPEDLNWSLRDSKKVPAAERDQLKQWVMDHARAWAIGWASVEEIDRLNILQATFLAMRRALDQLKIRPKSILVDGKLKIAGVTGSSPVVSGDSVCLSISAASILAKTARDGYMQTLHDQFPGYHFQSNAGYATADHIRAIYEHGLISHHRRSFRIPRHPDHRDQS